MKSILILIIMMFSFDAFSQTDPRTVIPSRNEDTYQKSGLFGRSPRFSEDTIKSFDYTDYKIDEITRHFEKYHTESVFNDSDGPFYYVSELAYGVGEVTCGEGFGIIAPTLQSADLTNLTAANWDTTTPETIWEAMDRIAALLKTLNAGTGP